MSKYIFFLSITWLAFGCKSTSPKATLNTGNKAPASCIDSTKINPDMNCVMIYKPVCGCNGKTYSNSCMAERAGVTKWTEGECK